ncbi:unnamed protein product [Bemisia tabaci]|uniref:Uncharacterized protein n=1 Tax=Bemisia tabaci TaxID=7038 RepID=A0A9P0A1J5_BEMTA|nr:unnamed protein product [Bemisia tabaci]
MRRKSPQCGGWHVKHISAYKTTRILPALRETQCGRRETHSAYKGA